VIELSKNAPEIVNSWSFLAVRDLRVNEGALDERGVRIRMEYYMLLSVPAMLNTKAGQGVIQRYIGSMSLTVISINFFDS
jgi:hypothetical protein